MFTVQMVYSACCVIRTDDLTILCDPWFTQGIHGGTWFHNPVLNEPMEIIGECDYIYISHIHEDHYDKEFLIDYIKALAAKNRYPKIIIAKRSNRNFLEEKMNRDNIEVNVIDGITRGRTTVCLKEYKSGKAGEIDSCLYIKHGKNTLLNINDISFSKEYMDKTFDDLDIDELTCLLTKHAGAGPFPQMYYELEELKHHHDAKVSYNKKQYKETIEYFNPEIVLPFAGDYVLGSGLAYLNEYRGMYDTIETPKIDNRSVPIDIETGKEFFDLETKRVSKIKTVSSEEYNGFTERIREIDKLNRKKWYPDQSDESVAEDLYKNLCRAVKTWSRRHKDAKTFNYFFYSHKESKKCIMISTNAVGINVYRLSQSYGQSVSKEIENSNYVCIFISDRLFLACTQRNAHWNNVFGGSQCMIRRHGDLDLCRRMEAKLWFLHN